MSDDEKVLVEITGEARVKFARIVEVPKKVLIRFEELLDEGDDDERFSEEFGDWLRVPDDVLDMDPFEDIDIRRFDKDAAS